MTPDQTKRVRKLLDELKRKLLDELKQMRGVGGVAKAGAVERGQVVPKLRAWIAKNGRRLVGHPDYEKLSQEEKRQTELLGWYIPEGVQLPLETVKSVLGKAPEGARIDLELKLSISVAVLASHPALLQWCKENASRIEGHPRYQHWDSLNTFGIYEAEAVALPQWQYERLLGALPEKAEEFVIYLGEEEWRHRRALYKVRLNGKVSF